MNKEIKEDVDAVVTETMKEFESSEKSPKVKTIVVHPELYQCLVLERGSLAMTWADPNKRPKDAPLTPSFADVITKIYNEKNALKVFIREFCRKHSELKEEMISIAKDEDVDAYQYLKAILTFHK